jgi:oligoendopeptidase F
MIEDVDRLRLLFTDERFETLKNDLEQAMTNYESLSSTFNEEIVPKAESIMKTIQDSEARGKQTLAELQRMAGEGRGTMQMFVANSTLAAQELILAQDEILSTLGLSLLERPTQLDLELMIREEALGMWARTATRIQLILGAVESLDIDPEEFQAAEEILQRLRGELQKTLEDYLAAQKRIFRTAEPPDPEVR